MQQGHGEQAQDAGIGVAKRLARPLGNGKAHGNGWNLVAATQVERNHFLGVFGNGILVVGVDMGFIGVLPFKRAAAHRAGQLPAAGAQLFFWPRAGILHLVLRAEVFAFAIDSLR